MVEHIPSVTQQGFDVVPVKSAHHDYNSGMILHQGRHFLASRRFNPDSHNCSIVIKVGTLRGYEDVAVLDLPNELGTAHFEDCRLFRHNGRIYGAYTEGRYHNIPFVAIQKLVLFDNNWKVEKHWTIQYGRNGFLYEKNWQFFSNPDTGHLHFVYSIQPHVVVELSDNMEVIDEVVRPLNIEWPWGTLSGGTPPVRVGHEYVSFFHSYVNNAKHQRRYSMSAYTFDDMFRVTAMTKPLLFGSEHDGIRDNPAFKYWHPLVVFPTGALYDVEQHAWHVSLGVNDLFDAIAEIPNSLMEYFPPEAFRSRPIRRFRTENAAAPVRLSRGQFLAWTPVGDMVGGVRAGELETNDPEVIDTLLGNPKVTAL